MKNQLTGLSIPMHQFPMDGTKPIPVNDALRLGYQLLNQNQLEVAATLSKKLLETSRAVSVQLFAAEVAMASGQLPLARQHLDTALAEHGEQPALLYKHSQILWRSRERRASLIESSRAAELARDDAPLLFAVAQFFLECNNPAAAKAPLRRATELLPNSAPILYETALCHYFLNDMEHAEIFLDRALKLNPHDGSALHLRSNLKTQTNESNHIEELAALTSSKLLSAQDLAAAQFAMAKELEDLGQFELSFSVLLEATTNKRRTLQYNVQSELEAMDSIKSHYSAERLSNIVDGDFSTGPIFIVGMPRTGTTLVERILAAHSAVSSVGEITDFPVEMSTLATATLAKIESNSKSLVEASSAMDFAKLGRNYLDAAGQMAAGKPFFIDKLPFNFRYCGLILKALPNARIIHLTRDPMDTCYAVFKTLFYNVYHFSYQLDELAQFYIGYRQMMAHWHSVMPGRILDVSYESLVASQEVESRRILDWCGLPWQDAVLDFHKTGTASTTASAAQIRRPIYRSSVQKWRQVAEQMQPVLQRLHEAGLVDSDGNPC